VSDCANQRRRPIVLERPSQLSSPWPGSKVTPLTVRGRRSESQVRPHAVHERCVFVWRLSCFDACCALFAQTSFFVTCAEARIPVLSFQHTQSAVKCDLVVNNVAAVANSALIRYFVEICSQKSSFKVAVQLIRRWARSRHLDLRGTPGLLSPYGWTILACHFGQQRGLLPAARDFLSGAACGTGGGSVPESLYITPGHVDLLSRDPKYFERQIALHFENASNTQSSGVAKRKSESADRESLAHASALDVAMEFFKYILCDFNTKHEVASLRFDAQDVTTRARCCSRHESEWVMFDQACWPQSCILHGPNAHPLFWPQVLEKVKHPSIRIEDPFEIHRNLGHKLHGKRLTLLQCEVRLESAWLGVIRESKSLDFCDIGRASLHGRFWVRDSHQVRTS